MPDPAIIPCPACGHRVQIPEAYLGQVVTCLQCKGPFRAPVREGGTFSAATVLPRRRGFPAMLFVPTFGLMLLGIVGIVLNGYLLGDPQAANTFARTTVRQLFPEHPPEATEWKAADAKAMPGDEEMKKRIARREEFDAEQDRRANVMADAWGPRQRLMRGIFLGVSGGVLLGGLAILIRRGRGLAFLGCGLASLNSPDLACCFPGAIVAVWGVFALISDDGRRWFGRV